jgi:multidrug/hemolysin transport system permease protein
MTLGYLVKRNIKMYFQDKGFFVTSLITPLILLLLYSTFLKNAYVSSFNSAVAENGISVAEKYINGFVYGWLLSSLIAVSSVTVAFCSNLLMVQDKFAGSIHDLEIAPISRGKIAIAYYLASMLETMTIILIEILIGFVILSSTGWFLTLKDIIGIIIGSFLLVNFGTALSSLIHYFLKTQGQMSAVGTLVSSVYGFICGAYMPISQFGVVLQRLLGFLPGTYATSLIRNHYERGVLEKLVSECNFPQVVVDNMAKSFDINVYFFKYQVPLWVSYLILSLSTIIIIVTYVIISIKNNKNKLRKKVS